jgi:hypothetical protein
LTMARLRSQTRRWRRCGTCSTWTSRGSRLRPHLKTLLLTRSIASWTNTMSGRIRTVKPEWLEDERLLACNSDARVLSVALLLMADDHGNGRAGPEATIAARVFPLDPSAYRKALDELLGWYVCLYEVGGQKYFAIRNWQKHQKVKNPSAPRVPEPTEETLRSFSVGSTESLTLDPDPVPRSHTPIPYPEGDPDPSTAGRESTPLTTAELLKARVPIQAASELWEHYRTQMQALRNAALTLMASAAQLAACKAVFVLCNGDMARARAAITAYVGSDHEWWKRKRWALHVLSDPRDFEQADLIASGVDRADAVTAKGKSYDERVAEELAELDAENRRGKS